MIVAAKTRLSNLFAPFAQSNLIIMDRIVAACEPLEAKRLAAKTLTPPELVVEPSDNLSQPIRCWTFLPEPLGAWPCLD